ncbi:hypothetical protein OAD54_00110 [Candidatus Pelagibacter sp.]|nr:hypothetical protein [Candidatus Pelagibacter sp.]|tara:strand:+ start:70 stop:492 length:423 start_codon:yes stop_codon:yes gene_type:complete
MNKLLLSTSTLIYFFLLSTSSFALGKAESPMWFITKTPEQIRGYYDNQSTSRLCIKWQERYPGSKMSSEVRGEISDALERRGEDGLKCSNTSSDNNQISQKKQQCALRRSEWRSMCSTGKYSMVNGVSCTGVWVDSFDCN